MIPPALTPSRPLAFTALLVALAAASPAAAQPASRSDALASLRARPGGVLGLMGFNMTPDGSTNAVQVNRSQAGLAGAQPELVLGQTGIGFTISESVPIFLEGYAGYARYDPRTVLTGAAVPTLPLRWNNAAATIGIGYDIGLTNNLFLRPILNFGAGIAASDVALFGSWLDWRFGTEIEGLTERHANVWSYGGSLMLAYYDEQPDRQIDFELRYTQLQIQTFGDTWAPIRGSSTAQTIGVWGRYRWPTGREMFGRELRWVLDGSASYYLGDQRDALQFAWSAKIGGGIEFDLGRQEISAAGLAFQRLRLVGRYFFGDQGVTGLSFSIGMSFY
jgi:hypothetical protein